ncbi:MAG TPA: NHLP leader peptide family RiPP precursor [Gemmataceae bacterium]|nr:NHLP leader peptide family RiPP precursor [Gemmataceae bacterium]
MSGDFEYQWGQLVARAWDDPAFKAKLIADPVAVLQENGVTPPAGGRLQVVENSADVAYLVLPTKPTSRELSEEELQSVAGGRGYEPCHRCGESCYTCRRCGDEGCYRCERC